MRYQWAPGFHPPKGVEADAVKGALDALPEPSPENLLEASKSSNHVLHEDLWSEGDQVWAQRGRLERCRKIIGSVVDTQLVGGKAITVRAVEFLRSDDDKKGQWVSIESIVQDSDLLDAYLAEVQRLQDQASAKMAKVRALLAQSDKDRAA